MNLVCLLRCLRSLCLVDTLAKVADYSGYVSLPRVHAQGVKQSVCMSVVVVVVIVVGTKIARPARAQIDADAARGVCALV